MRWMQTVGMVRWRQIHPDLKEILSGDVGLVRWCRIGMGDETWDFLNGNHRVRVRFGGPRQQICYRSLAAGVNSTGSDPRPEATCDLASFRGSSRCVSPISLRAQVLQSIT